MHAGRCQETFSQAPPAMRCTTSISSPSWGVGGRGQTLHSLVLPCRPRGGRRRCRWRLCSHLWATLAPTAQEPERLGPISGSEAQGLQWHVVSTTSRWYVPGTSRLRTVTRSILYAVMQHRRLVPAVLHSKDPPFHTAGLVYLERCRVQVVSAQCTLALGWDGHAESTPYSSPTRRFSVV